MDRQQSHRKLLRSSLAVLIVSLALFGGSSIDPAFAETRPCDDCGVVGTVSPGDDGIGVTESQNGDTSNTGGVAGDLRSSVAYEYTYVTACPNDKTLDPVQGFTSSEDCQAAHSCPDATQTRMHVAQRTVASTGTGPWTYVGTQCLGPTQMPAFDPAAAGAFALDYFQHLPLPEPGVHVQPGDRQVVNLPTIVSADAPPVGQWSVTHAPFPTIAITGTPHWTIDFGDGSVLTSDDPGRAFDGTNPVADPRHYLAHAYTEPASARTVTVTVTWTAIYTLGADPTPLAMNGTVTRTSATTVPVDEAESLLTNNS